jgi:hypothetical protein
VQSAVVIHNKTDDFYQYYLFGAKISLVKKRHILIIKKGMITMMMTKLSYSGLKYGESEVEIKLLVDIQNDWFEITHTKEVSQVMNKSTGEYIVVNRNTLKFEVVS